MKYDIKPVSLFDTKSLFKSNHGYKSVGGTATYCFGVIENESIIAAYVWQPPAPGAALSVCNNMPAGVLSLSRMVAVPKTERVLKHVSKPLKHQMHKLIDRTRWPVLVTYSDSSLGHNGYVYECSGWEKTTTSVVPYYVDSEGSRVSIYSNGKRNKRTDIVLGGYATLQRWEHWVCPKNEVRNYMEQNGWFAVPTGKLWRSGNPAMKYVQITPLEGKQQMTFARRETHTCHAFACITKCRPEHLMCAYHWRMVPPELQREVWRHYRPGQCDDMRPSKEWFYAADMAIAAVARKEGHEVAARVAERMAVQWGTPAAPEPPAGPPKPSALARVPPPTSRALQPPPRPSFLGGRVEPNPGVPGPGKVLEYSMPRIPPPPSAMKGT